MVDDKFVAMHDLLKRMGITDAGQTTVHASHWQRYGIGALVNFSISFDCSRRRFHTVSA